MFARIAARGDRFAGARPLLFAVLFGGAKNTVADVIVQNRFEGHDLRNIDLRRTAVFATFGLFYVGAAQFVLFNRVLPRLFGRGLLQGDRRAALKAVGFDQIVHMPFMYFPVFYTIREFGIGECSWENALRDWRACLGPDMILQAGIFVPVQIVNFRNLPVRYRVPWTTTFGFLYVMALSATRGRVDSAEDTQK